MRSTLLERFESLGYRTQCHVLNAKDFGVAQSRARAFFIGTRAPYPVVSKVAPIDPNAVTVYQILKDLPAPGERWNEGALLPPQTCLN